MNYSRPDIKIEIARGALSFEENKDCNPYTVDFEHILCDDVIFSWESNPHSVRLWVIGNEYGALCAVWAGNLQDALDIAYDKDLLGNVDPDGMHEDDLTHLGNAGELANITNIWAKDTRLENASKEVLCRFAEARGGAYDTLDM